MRTRPPICHRTLTHADSQPRCGDKRDRRGQYDKGRRRVLASRSAVRDALTLGVLRAHSGRCRAGFYIDVHLLLAAVEFPVNVPLFDLSQIVRARPRMDMVDKQA